MSKAQDWYEQRLEDTGWPEDDMCDPPTDDKTAMSALIGHLLGPTWYVTMPESSEQINTVAVYEIIRQYVDNRTRLLTTSHLIMLFVGIVIGILAMMARGG